MYVADGLGSGSFESITETTGTAAANYALLADGAGSGSWELLNPFGGIIYNDVAGAGTTYTTPTVYTLLNHVTTETNLNDFTTNDLGRLTYTGTVPRHCHAVFDASYKHSTGAGANVFFTIYKNGVMLNGYEAVGAADSSGFERMALHYDDMMTTNDYYEVYVKTPTGNVTFNSSYLFMMGMPG